MIKIEKIKYVENMMNELIESLKTTFEEIKIDRYIFASSNRAKFKRLRIELTKELYKIEKELYK